MNRHLIAILAAIVLGFASVAIWGGAMVHVYWLGQFFLTSLKMIIVPLIVFTMISGVTGLGDVRKLGKLGGVTLAYYAVTTLVAVVVGAIVVNIIRPGEGLAASGLSIPERVAEKSELGFTDIVMSFVSGNIVESMANMEMLPIIVFSLVFGGVLSTLGEQGRALREVCEAGNLVMMRIVQLLMWLAPIGIFGLIAGRFGSAVAEAGAEGFWAQIRSVGAYMASVLVGLSIHALIILPVILAVLTRYNPLRYARGMGTALLTAFSTASSAATLPLTLEAVEKNNKVDPRSAHFVMPLGATVNMDGTALYEAVAVLFIAQALGVDMTLGQQFLVVIMASLAAIGAAGIPEAGLVTMVMVLRAVDLPLEGIELILAVDWILDRFRTTVNIWGDAVGAAVVERVVFPEAQPPESMLPGSGAA